MKLYRLIYVSDKVKYLELADFKEILVKSEENNSRLGITGLLAILDHKFLQVLEGPGLELNALYEKLMRDARHKNPRLISYEAIHDRHFKTWSMRGVNWSAMNPKITSLLLKKYGESKGTLAISDDPWLTYSLLYDIYCHVHFSEWAENADLNSATYTSEKIATNYERYRVLVVEDEAVVRNIIVKMLQQIGFKYIGEADSGVSALHEIDKLPPDLILCDVEMKPLDGLSFLQILHNSQSDYHPKFIFVTVHAEPGIVARANELGADGFITKPVKLDQLRYQIETVVNPSSTRISLTSGS